ncbi:carbon-nitrogen hydrolase family protein [Methanospirillum sp. J.3.6.1-F.2.7.3]|jgi:omega-amidase|uniref:Carbon-nitrogen hydrolase family protein n=2 Tax=Methanospirillum TaxID=2202 RepID=A0A8E7AXV6_9EURY|nr:MULTISPECIES: carbon-nitrogen hydrolase family protein [Methanospirillum]MDX8550110.1 carbon-nitrogen hydrolase family protein [Methanospirillum hungatei]NLW76763.1 carbon-nitrogen hydrolase family protein [Methanomicrobiales archaeon]QVV87473.1 carbon-nitrogen hydrolase family protein [Methanospirillum sp. J.3.6.1-F.2.7.3]QXO94937.1 carbon-nitrogen hydrolase family protein [Methanospirillum hungatei]
MILCLAQMTPCWNDPLSGLKKIRTCVAEAVEGDASFIAFPEQFLTGWDPNDTSWTFDESEEEISQLREIARDYSIGILGSFREKRNGPPRNTCIAIGPDGRTCATYSKIHLFSPASEDRYYAPGDSLGIFSFDSCKIGLAICYDLRFATLFQAYRNKGVNLMLVPSAWPAARLKHFNLFTTSRAAEFQTFVASINTVGTTPVDVYTGGSCIAGPDGTIRARGSDLEELIFYEVKGSEADTIRAEFPVHQDMQKANYDQI